MTEASAPEPKPLPPINEQVFLEGLLTGMLNPKSANTVATVPGIRFHTGNSEYQSATDANGKFALGVINDASIRQVEITAPGGKPRYFKQLASADDAATRTEGLTPTGFKAIAWVETDKGGNVSKGKPNVVLAFAGYDGHPYDKSPQTKSMYAVSDSNRYPQMDAVPAFLADMQKALVKETGSDKADIHVVAHSLGASNALKAAVDLEKTGKAASSVLLVEPVGASLARDKLIEGEAGKETMAAVLVKTTSIRAVTESKATGELAHSKSAMLQTYGDHNPGRSAPQVRQDNIDNTVSPFRGPRNGAIDKNNESVGTELLMNVTGQRIIAVSLGARLDGTHATGSLTNAAANNAAIDTPENARKAARDRATGRDNKVSLAEPSHDIPLERAMAHIDRLMASMDNPLGLATAVLQHVFSERAILQGTQMVLAQKDYNVTAMQEGTKTSIPNNGIPSSGRIVS